MKRELLMRYVIAVWGVWLCYGMLNSCLMVIKTYLDEKYPEKNKPYVFYELPKGLVSGVVVLPDEKAAKETYITSETIVAVRTRVNVNSFMIYSFFGQLSALVLIGLKGSKKV